MRVIAGPRLGGGRRGGCGGSGGRGSQHEIRRAHCGAGAGSACNYASLLLLLLLPTMPK